MVIIVMVGKKRKAIESKVTNKGNIIFLVDKKNYGSNWGGRQLFNTSITRRIVPEPTTYGNCTPREKSIKKY